MSSARSRSKFCLSLDSSSSDTSDDTHLNRWSEVVPPKTALTFAVLWDPVEGMVTFSGAALLESESLSGMPSHSDVFDDDQPQFVAIDRDLDSGTTAGENTAALATFQDAFKVFLHHTPWQSTEHLHAKTAGSVTPRCLQTRASSTFNGLDVYSHDPQPKSGWSLELSCSDLLDIESSLRTPPVFRRLRLRSDLMLDSYSPELEQRESDSGNRLSYLRSRFSTTTTSTSNYVDVTASAFQSTRTSEILPVLELHESACSHPTSLWPSIPQRRRVLRKRRPLDEVIGPSTTCPMPSTPKKFTMTSKASTSWFTFPHPSPAATAAHSPRQDTMTRGEAPRGRFLHPVGAPILSPAASTPPRTPPAAPKSPGLRLRFTMMLLPGRRKSRSCQTCTPEVDSDGWVLIEVAPIRQLYLPDLDSD